MELKETIKQINKMGNASQEEIQSFVEERIKSIEDQYEPEFYNLKSGYKMWELFKPDHLIANRCFFTEDRHKIYIGCGIGDQFCYYCDANEDLLSMFIQEVKNKQIKTREELCKTVSKVVSDYYGGIDTLGTTKDRLSHIKCDDDLDLDNNEKNYLSSFKGTQNAWCVERAIATHQLFLMLGAESEIVDTDVIVDGKTENHALNMVRIGGQTLLIDNAMIDYKQLEESNGEYSGIVQILPPESFDTFEGVEERRFFGKEGQERSCVYSSKKYRFRVVEEKMATNENEVVLTN